MPLNSKFVFKIYQRHFGAFSVLEPLPCGVSVFVPLLYMDLWFRLFPPFGLILTYALQTRDPPILPPFSAIFEGNTVFTGYRITCCLSYNFIERKALREPQILSLDGMIECDTIQRFQTCF